MQSRAAIMEEIDKVLARSQRIYEAQKARYRGNVEAAFSGAGFQTETTAKLAMIRKVRPNEGFRKGGVADTFGSTGHPSDDLFPQNTGEVHQFSTEALVDIGPKPDTVFYDRFREAMASQYPTVEAMHSIARPMPAGTFEQRYSQSTAPKYEPTSGPPIVASPDKTRTMTLQKSAGQTRLAKLTRLEKILTVLAAYVDGNDEAGRALGIT